MKQTFRRHLPLTYTEDHKLRFITFVFTFLCSPQQSYNFLVLVIFMCLKQNLIFYRLYIFFYIPLFYTRFHVAHLRNAQTKILNVDVGKLWTESHVSGMCQSHIPGTRPAHILDRQVTIAPKFFFRSNDTIPYGTTTVQML
jgi:hypothetical protein